MSSILYVDFTKVICCFYICKMISLTLVRFDRLFQNYYAHQQHHKKVVKTVEDINLK